MRYIIFCVLLAGCCCKKEQIPMAYTPQGTVIYEGNRKIVEYLPPVPPKVTVTDVVPMFPQPPIAAPDFNENPIKLAKPMSAPDVSFRRGD